MGGDRSDSEDDDSGSERDPLFGGRTDRPQRGEGGFGRLADFHGVEGMLSNA